MANPANTNASTISRAQPNRSQATTVNKNTPEATDVLVVASARGFDSTAGVTIREGEEFYVTRKQARIGASWFDVKDETLRDEIDAEREQEEKKKSKETRAGRIAAAVTKADSDTEDLA